MRHLHRHHMPSGTPLAGIDPRIRLLAALLVLVLVVSSSGPAFPWLVVAICLPAAVWSGLPLRLLCLRLLHPLFIALVVLVLKALLGSGPSFELVRLGDLVLTAQRGGIHEGVATVARIIGAAAVAVLLSQILNFTETMAALAWLRAPRGLVDVSLFAWRALFLLYDDAAVVYTAQRNRLGYCGVRRGLRSFGALAGMLTIRAFDASHAVTLAMSQRGYDGTLPLLRGSRLSPLQVAGLLLFALAAGTAWRLQN